MNEAEEPRKEFWNRKRIIAAAIAAVAGVSVWFVCVYGPGPVLEAWHEVKSLSMKAFHDVLGSSDPGLALEIGVSSSTDSVPEDARSSTVSAVDSPVDGSGGAAPVADGAGSQASEGNDSPKIILNAGGKPTAPPPLPSPPPLSLPAPAAVIAATGDSAAFATSSRKDAAIAPVVACNFSGMNAPTHKILFNEIAWMGSVPAAGETGAQASNREWMELRNNAGADIDLSGWQVMDDSGKLKIQFDQGARLGFGEFFLLERGDDSSVPGIAADKIYTGILANTGGWLRLFDRDCALVDEINASSGSVSLAVSGWPGGDNSTKATLERDLMDLDWHTSGYSGGTPKAQNTVVWTGGSSSGVVPPPPPAASQAGSSSSTINTTSTQPADTTSTLPDPLPSPPPPPPVLPPPSVLPGHLVIYAVQIAGAATSNDLLRIFNPTAASVDMSAWKLRKRTGTGTESSLRVLPAGSVIQPQQYFTWANSANGFASSMGADASSSETLAAGNSVALEDASGTMIDALAWGSGSTNPFVEGAPYPTDPAAGQLLSRKVPGGAVQDTDNNAYDFELK